MQGLHYFINRISVQQQISLVQELRLICKESPLFTPTMKSGAKFKYQMTNCGELGWVSDRQGYRYTDTHPITNQQWPAMPQQLKAIVNEVVTEIGISNFKPQCCLINYYKVGERLGLHQDNTEENLEAPIISISLGDTGIFGIGGLRRNDPIRDIYLESGDILVMSGKSRMRFHEMKGIVSGSSNLLKNGGRLNLTIRQVY